MARVPFEGDVAGWSQTIDFVVDALRCAGVDVEVVPEGADGGVRERTRTEVHGVWEGLVVVILGCLALDRSSEGDELVKESVDVVDEGAWSGRNITYSVDCYDDVRAAYTVERQWERDG